MIKIMANLLAPEQLAVPPASLKEGSPGAQQTSLLPALQDPQSVWNPAAIGPLLLLVALWAVKLYTTWGAWGNLTIDSGHEMYVPALLAEGKQLYRDVWFMYGPAAPYFTSYLYRMFGVHLNVLYWAGALSALGSAVFLFLTGMRLSSHLAGWVAGAVVLVEAFHPSLFCFPLPYTSAAVYGCFVACLFVWLLINACASARWLWIFSAGIAAAVALLLKPEFGIACYGALTLLIVLRAVRERSWKRFGSDLAATLPGVGLCALVIGWMISIAGVQFITQENLVSWPTSYFMKTYGKIRLAQTGFALTRDVLHDALLRAALFLMTILVACCVLWWKRADRRSVALKWVFAGLLITYFVTRVYASYPPSERLGATLSTVFFPTDMVVYVAVGALAAWGYFWYRRGLQDLRNAALPLLLTFSGLLAFRILVKMAPDGYAIYYNGPVILSFLLLLILIIPRTGHSRRFVFLAELVICLGCLTPAVLRARQMESLAKDYVPLSTDRGTVRISKHLAENYLAAMRFMKEKAALGESVLSVPEDTSLYFLSGTYCPIRVFAFTPGVVAPGQMTQKTIREIQGRSVRYLLWSNRTFVEYGAPIFGRDFDVPLGDYFKSHYRRVGPLISNSGAYWDWTAIVWERRPEGQLDGDRGADGPSAPFARSAQDAP